METGGGGVLELGIPSPPAEREFPVDGQRLDPHQVSLGDKDALDGCLTEKSNGDFYNSVWLFLPHFSFRCE